MSENDNITDINRILSFDLNCSDFVVLKCNNLIGTRIFLLDTQADISIIKQNAVDSSTFINDDDTVRIRGVTNGLVETFGTIDSDILTNITSVPHEFHVVADNFGVPSDGIIGKDFIKRHKCNIDYENMELTFKYDNNAFSFEIFDSIDSDTIVVPPRSETFRNFKITNYSEPQFIPNAEISGGVFVANTIAYDRIVTIRILNTTDETRIISNSINISENLSDYAIFDFDAVTGTEKRLKNLIGIIRNNSPEFIQETLLKLCSRYSNIFALESDTLTQNNFYERLTDNIPCRYL